jgi:C4-dicarboxylate-specific signal transduction histidine kinase
MVWTDPEIAALVLYSLLENALDATAGQRSPQISVSATDDGRQIALHVTDNGCGVPAGFQSKLFQWGETTKTQGLGSALAFARARMRLLQGDLIFPLPQPSTGAIFEMRLARPTVSKDTA